MLQRTNAGTFKPGALATANAALLRSSSDPRVVAQFAGADEYVRGQLHRKLGDGLAFIAVDGTQQFAHARRIDDRAVVSDRGRGQRAAQVAGWIRREAGGCHRIAEHRTS